MRDRAHEDELCLKGLKKVALGLRAQDFGELTVFGVFGLLFLVLISMTVLTQHARRKKRIKGSDSLVRG